MWTVTEYTDQTILTENAAIMKLDEQIYQLVIGLLGNVILEGHWGNECCWNEFIGELISYKTQLLMDEVDVEDSYVTVSILNSFLVTRIFS